MSGGKSDDVSVLVSSSPNPNKHVIIREPFTTRNKKKITITIYSCACLLLVLAISGIVFGVKNRSSEKKPLSASAHAVLKSSCSSTLYPELCYSAAAAAPGADASLLTPKNVIQVSLNITTEAVKLNLRALKKLAAKRGAHLTKREQTALSDCVETVEETLDELHEAAADLEGYPNAKKSLAQHADDLKTLMSAAMTNQETCLDGFSHEGADKKVRKLLLKGEKYGEKLCSNVLAMIKNMTDADMVLAGDKAAVEGRRLGEDGWPEWISAGDRRLLQAGGVRADTVVAADGSGNHKTVAAAVAAAPTKSSKRYVIRIKAGVYGENVDIPKSKTNIMFMGDGRKTTIITGSRNVQGGSTTFNSATVAAVGAGFLARDITFQNTAGPSGHQAVALRVGSDLSAFYQCDMLAYQDTLYVHSNRQFYINCFIAGTVDFIFGNAAAVFQDCDIHARRPNAGQKNMLTAQGRADPNQNTGIVIQKCRIGATADLRGVQASFPTYLGRPWKEYSRTVVMQSDISNVIHPAGWFEWSGNFALNTLYYGEHRNTGAGSGTANRVRWKGYRVITNVGEAQGFTARRFVGGGSWLAGTGFPFSLDL